MPKSTNTYQSTQGINLLFLLITTFALADAQSECAAKAFPLVIPMRINESLVINLQNYFEGSNISYAVTPNNQYSSIDNTFECQEKANQNEGKIIASHFLSEYELQIQSNLIDAGANTYILAYLLTNTFKITTLQLPKQSYTNCSEYALRLLNQTYLQAVIHCVHSQQPQTSVLLTMVTTIYSKDPVWNFLSIPFFASDAIDSAKLLFSKQMLLRGVPSATNSYIEIWHWSQQVKELLGVADRTLLGVSKFDLRSMQLHGNALVVLDYNCGLHVLRITSERKFLLIGSIFQPYFQLFTYNAASGALYLAKKGKVVTALLKNLDSKSIVTGSSFNLYAYQRVKQIVVSDQKLVVLGENIISVFALSDRSSYRHYNLYNAQGTAAFFQLYRPNEPLTLILPKQRQGVIRYYTCAVRSPLLRLYTPSGAVQVKIMGYSMISGDISTCRQNFTVKPMDTDLDLIYDNGYRADDEVLFANLPGSGVIELQKYGAGRNVRYEVSKDAQSKIDYIATVRKQQSQQCTIQNRQISPSGNIYYSKTWENLLITQLSSDFSLKYFFCRLESGPSCTYAVEIPSMKPVDLSAYELIDKTTTYSISYEALVQENGNSLNVLVRKLIVLGIAEQLQISVFCTIKIDDFVQEFANITQIEIKNGRLFLLMPFRKQIRIYDLVDGTCPLLTSLSSSTFPDSYFAPRSLHFDQIPTNERQQIIFIRQWDQLLTVRLVGSPLTVSLVSKNKLQQVKEGSLVIARPYLVYLSDSTNKVDVYRLDDSHELQYLRQISLEGLHFSSSGKNSYYSVLDYTHLSLRLIDPTTKVQYLKIFAIDQLISVASEYLSINMMKDDQVATFFSPASAESKQLIFLQLLAGPSTGFLLCRSFRIYLRPSILFSFTAVRSTSDSYSENVTLTLATADNKIGHKFKISLSNIGLALTRGSTFPRKGTSVTAASQIFLDDSHWFSGSVYNYEFDCKNCNDRIKFLKKINMDSQQQIPLSSKKFLLDRQEKRIQAVTGPFLVEMQFNHTPWPLNGEGSTGYGLSHAIALSSGTSECIDAISIPEKNVILALCFRLNSENKRQYTLSLVSTLSMSYFVVTQSTLNLEDDLTTLKLAYKDDLIVVYSSKMAILLVIWQVQDSLQLIELDVIDEQDISDSICTLQLISNATSPMTSITSILYGLLLTQCSSSLYYTSFSIYIDQTQAAPYSIPSIHVSYSQNINILKALSQKRIQIPTDARIIQTITKLQPSQIEIEESFSFFIIFDRFHSYKFKLVTSKQGRIIKSITVDAVFYKFGANTAVSAQLQTYLVVKYVLDLGFGKLQQLYGCFDLDKYLTNKDQVKEYYTFASDIFKKFQQLSAIEEDFPWIMRGNRIFHLHNDRFQVLSLNSNLIANITGLDANDSETQVLYTQNIIITANNPISARSASIILSSVDKFELSDLQIALIVVGSIVLLIVLIIGGRILGRKIKKKLKLVPLSQNTQVEDAVLEDEETQRAGQWLINKSDRGSMEP